MGGTKLSWTWTVRGVPEDGVDAWTMPVVREEWEWRGVCVCVCIEKACQTRLTLDWNDRPGRFRAKSNAHRDVGLLRWSVPS